MPSQEKFDPTFHFQVGERVADKPKMTSINMGQHFGTVTDLILKLRRPGLVHVVGNLFKSNGIISNNLLK